MGGGIGASLPGIGRNGFAGKQPDAHVSAKRPAKTVLATMTFRVKQNGLPNL
jgi:hypothetical protein